MVQLLSNPQYTTEFSVKVVSLIPTLLRRFKCALVPGGEGIFFPCMLLPMGYPGAAGSTRLEGLRVRERRVMNYEKINRKQIKERA